MDLDFSDNYIVNNKFSISDSDTEYKGNLSKDDGKKILEDEKVLGTIHIAFGNNVGMGGNVNIPIHIDGIITKPTVYFDDEVVMEKGKLLI